MRLEIDRDEITLDDFINLEELTVRSLRDFMARFLVDDSGKKVEEDEAKRRLGALKGAALREMGVQLRDALKELQNEIVPPFKDGGS